MKIYHTETQADYHALIIELEDQGCFWAYGGKSTKWRDEIWEVYKGSTCVGVQSNKQMQYCGIDYYKEEYPDIPIIKYKAKQEGHTMTPEQEREYNFDIVDKPRHYIGIHGLEVETVLENFLPKITDGYVAHRVGSAIEYILRHPEKNGRQDLEKAKKNLEQVFSYLEETSK